jgi:phosphate transport system substrate-binding protein
MIKSNTSHQSYINLIDKEADFILNARSMSSDEKVYAEDKGVSLTETPVAADALVFIVNPKNPITSLTGEQIQDIYTGKITNWKEVGGNDAEIMPFVRNPNSGSQELMESFFDVPRPIYMNNVELTISSMTGAVDAVFSNENAICFTVYYYKENIATGSNVKTVAVDGVNPDKVTIGNKSYPYVAPVYAVIRSDLDKLSMAYKLYEWVQTTAGAQTVSESGYVPY